MKRSWLLAVIILLITACTPSGINPIIEVSSISISPASLALLVGEKEHLIASIYPSDATNKEIRWESDNSEVAIVDDQGFVAAFKEGSAIIIATSLANGIRATCYISVLPMHIAVESVNLDKSELSLITGDVAALTLTILPNDATNQIVNWESSDTNIVTVVNGQITDVNSGQANIIASVEGKSAVCSVNVRNRVVPDGGADIGLSVYWAKCNLGAASPEDYGDCYSWGEIESKSYL